MSATAASFTKLLAWRPGGYLRASGALFAWLAVRTLAQTALFVLVARTLGADGYGSLIAVMAIATLFAPLAGLGGQSLLVRDVARNPEKLTTHLGDALRLWAISVAPLSLLAYLACALLLPPALPAYAIAAIVLAELAGASLLELLARTWQALQCMAGFGAMMAGLIVARLAVFCALLAVAPPSPAAWAVWYAAVTAAYVLLAGAAALRRFGTPRPSDTPFTRLLTAGFPFAFASSAMRIQAEANKPILARLDTMAGAGVFSAAQRVTDLLAVPLQAMLETLTPRALRAAPTARIVFMLGTPALAFAGSGGLVIAAAASWLPSLLGPSFESAVAATRMLAFLPLLLAVRLLLTTVIMARGEQRHFYGAYGLGAVISILAAAALVPRLGVTGAAIAAYAPEAALIAFQGWILARPRRTQP
ncbi:MAG: oligosaccharide flippase family protein [Pseudomonadota bacterium]